jgi:hypothetical protein
MQGVDISLQIDASVPYNQGFCQVNHISGFVHGC